MGEKFRGAMAGLGMLAASGSANAENVSSELQADLNHQSTELRAAKDSAWMSTLSLDNAGELDAAGLTQLKKEAKILAESDEIQLLLKDLNKLIAENKLDAKKANTIFQEATFGMDKDVLMVKVNGIGTTEGGSPLAIIVAQSLRGDYSGLMNNDQIASAPKQKKKMK